MLETPFPKTSARRRAPRPEAVLRDLTEGWHARVRSRRLRAGLAAATLVVFLAFLVARRGTMPTRAAAVIGLLTCAVAAVVLRFRERALWTKPARVIRRLAEPVDPERAGRAIRALALTREPSRASSHPVGTSLALARLHVERTLDALPRDQILERAARVGKRYGQVTLLFGLLTVALAATRGFGIFEGGDVFLATYHEAPLPVLWLDAIEIGARPPDYLHAREQSFGPYGSMALPRGTLLTFRGMPLHAGRRLLLGDGVREVPFVDDGSGHVVARWPLAESVSLKVLARFGDVAVREADATTVTSIADQWPTVVLEDAPREVRLTDVGVGASIALKYEASDDHGLREVHLVLRSGAREERRILARLDGETETNRGGHTLRTNDPFLKQSHAPVEIRVEAKDNDPVTGPKWGASEAITVIPPDAGEPEALRMDALGKLRDALVDSLGERLERIFPIANAGRAALAEVDRLSVLADERLLERTSKASFAGLHVSGRLVALLGGHMRRVKEALTAELRSPGSASHARLVAATERLVLVTDAVARGLSQRDARTVARTLADVADDLVLGLSQAGRAEERERGRVRADSGVVVLNGGARSLRRLGSLGRDLGEIVQTDLLRIARARDASDWVHAEIAATDLAARLKDPDPSFGAQGGSGGRAGGESGGGRGSPGTGTPSDEAQEAFDQAASEVDKLAADHAEELGKVEQTLNAPLPSEEEKASSQEDKNHARAVRDATTPLPSVGAGSDSWTNKGASAREHAEAMARALEEGNASDAVASGRSALDALEEAKHIAQRERGTGLFSSADQNSDRTAADRRLEAARQKLLPEVEWAEGKLRAMRKAATERMTSDLSARGEEEQRIADRAAALGTRGDGERPLPEAALEALHEAARAAERAATALKRGEAEEALTEQREAQRKLEAAKAALGGESGEDRGGPTGGDDPRSGHADIPNADAHKGPEEFRRRVIEGLGQSAGGKQKDAVRRYADGLLR